MRNTLLIGSGNLKKAAEIADLLDGLPWIVKSLADFPPVREPEETGTAFEENALLKARYYSKLFHVATAADDSGLVVDALDGAPGVQSARYAGEQCDDAANNAKLLAALADVPAERRIARFVCCAAIAFPEGQSHVEMGTVEGRIAPEPRGSRGFGYDPLFIPEGYTLTFGELDPEIKRAISHRARAMHRLRDYVRSLE